MDKINEVCIALHQVLLGLFWCLIIKSDGELATDSKAMHYKYWISNSSLLSDGKNSELLSNTEEYQDTTHTSPPPPHTHKA